MKRETIFAIVIGIVLGGGIGLFVLFKSNSGQETKVIPVSGDTEDTKVVNTAVSSSQTVLTVSTPSENVVVHEKEVQIKGKAEPNSLMVIQSPVSNQVFKNEKQDFSVNFPLALGENIVSISSYSESSTPQEITLQIYYVEE